MATCAACVLQCELGEPDEAAAAAGGNEGSDCEGWTGLCDHGIGTSPNPLITSTTPGAGNQNRWAASLPGRWWALPAAKAVYAGEMQYRAATVFGHGRRQAGRRGNRRVLQGKS